MRPAGNNRKLAGKACKSAREAAAASCGVLVNPLQPHRCLWARRAVHVADILASKVVLTSFFPSQSCCPVGEVLQANCLLDVRDRGLAGLLSAMW